MSKIKSYFEEVRILFRNLPAVCVSLFVLSVVLRNLLANKTIVETTYLALDGGFFVSWLCFLTRDRITKHYGPRAANQLNVFARLVNLFCSVIFYLISIIPTKTDYSAFNSVFSGTWFILLSSTIAFLLSGVVNNVLNYLIGKLFHKNPDGKLAYFTRSYVSTFIGQFIDNLTFALLTFRVFAPIFWDGYSWTIIQCTTCAITGAVFELLAEVVFSPIGYYFTKKWEKNGIGKEYLNYRSSKRGDSYGLNNRNK